MHFYKALLAVPAMVALATAATLPIENRAATDNCQDNLGDCYSNGCAGVFENPNDTTGQCTAGTWKGCPCEKCGGGNGYVGACDANGCAGYQGVCMSGDYQGCGCN
ncbi:uncharacterized protein N7484_011097 [Penicillium longicatenatum]|uniref:uncharacterized protein n=1 Tax=Penicillium longicatenatum TaxID=1561947 RepID=UPI0025473E42|nr:uncharacterized protein N7484_011097 [Penicillium longicatenatum]KAJ5630997.1 hypothetical protein N7484_011097 [Penicillium longicatenatum]